MKREDYISWDDYFMAIALLSAKRSKDPSTQVGSCVINKDNKIVGIGYNGFPNRCSDDILPWDREGDPLDTKYIYVCHAELNAIMNATQNLKDCTIYTSLFPCNECAKMIIQAGIRKVIYFKDTYKDKDFSIAAKKMFELANIKYISFTPKMDEFTIKFI